MPPKKGIRNRGNSSSSNNLDELVGGPNGLSINTSQYSNMQTARQELQMLESLKSIALDIFNIAS